MAFSAVEHPRSALRTPTSPSHRSFPSLHHLSLAPLSSNFSDQALDTDEHPMDQLTTSYIQQRTAPSTPGILSRSSSRHRSHLNVRYVDATSYFPDDTRSTNTAMTKAKSDAHLDTGSSDPVRHHSRSKSSTFALSTRRPAPFKGQTMREAPDDGWLYRAGLAIASETRESKGQSWLSRRESSTSLVRQAHSSDSDEEYRNHHHNNSNINTGTCSGLQSRTHSAMFADDEYSPVTPRFGSRQQSRRGSRVAGMGMTPMGSRTPMDILSRCSSADYLDVCDDVPMDPDFVDDEGSSVAEDDEEIARLARERGFGLGGWMDKLMGWTLFSVGEDGEDMTDDESSDLAAGDNDDEFQRRREMEVKRRRDEWARIEIASRAAQAKNFEDLPEPRDSEGGWQDAAWLLSVATKVLL